MLPDGFSSPSLTVQVHADNVATIYLNGVQIGQQPFAETFTNFQDPPESFTVTDPSRFQAGANILEFDIYNFGGPTAFDYKATVTFTPELGADLAVSLTDAPDPVRRGEQLTYTATVQNAGPDEAQDVALTLSLTGSTALITIEGDGVDPDTDCTITYKGSSSFPLLASLTCNLGDFPSGAEGTLVVTVQPTKAETLTATASVEAASPDDPEPDNNTATATTTVTRGR